MANTFGKNAGALLINDNIKVTIGNAVQIERSSAKFNRPYSPLIHELKPNHYDRILHENKQAYIDLGFFKEV